MCHRQIKITTYDRLLRAWEGKFYGGGKRIFKAMPI